MKNITHLHIEIYYDLAIWVNLQDVIKFNVNNAVYSFLQGFLESHFYANGSIFYERPVRHVVRWHIRCQIKNKESVTLIVSISRDIDSFVEKVYPSAREERVKRFDVLRFVTLQARIPAATTRGLAFYYFRGGLSLDLRAGAIIVGNRGTWGTGK